MPKVSVTILTYNQAAFIGEAIESAVNQITDFEYEILVGDDYSNDGTRDIILEYQKKYPDKVKPVFHTKNLGQNGLFNTIETLKLAQGQYIAHMDGDDYWTDPQKLQRQADFMDAHPTYSACFHNAYITYEDGTPTEELNPPDQKPVIEADDLIGEQEIWFMATSAVMFRNGLMHYPDWFLKSSSGDIPRYIILTKFGPIGYLPYIMSVYRKNTGGASFRDYYWDERFLRNRIMMYSGINKETGYKHDRTLKLNIARYYRMLLDAKQYKDSYFRKAGLAFYYLSLKKPSFSETREIVRDYILPKWIMRVYSFFALLPHRLRGTTQ
ncbi:hypothetical protein GCM10027291_40830 [Telluribacter humicola]